MMKHSTVVVHEPCGLFYSIDVAQYFLILHFKCCLLSLLVTSPLAAGFDCPHFPEGRTKGQHYFVGSANRGCAAELINNIHILLSI